MCDCEDDCLVMAAGRLGRELASSAEAMLTSARAAGRRQEVKAGQLYGCCFAAAAASRSDAGQRFVDWSGAASYRVVVLAAKRV